MGMQGDLHYMSVADLIQNLCMDRKEAELLIDHGEKMATLYFRKGTLVHAVQGQLSGEDAVYETLRWDEGTFAVQPGIKSPGESITKSWSNLLLEGARQRDEERNKHGQTKRALEEALRRERLAAEAGGVSVLCRWANAA